MGGDWLGCYKTRNSSLRSSSLRNSNLRSSSSGSCCASGSSCTAGSSVFAVHFDKLVNREGVFSCAEISMWNMYPLCSNEVEISSTPTEHFNKDLLVW